MRKFVLFFICAFLMMGCSSPAAKTMSLGEKLIESNNYASVTELAKEVTPAVVGVVSTSGGEQSVGSGVCVAGGGYVLTNCHVLTNKDSIVLYLSNGDTTNATYVWGDDSQDIAIIRSEIGLPYLELSNDDQIDVGQDVVAIGTPLSLLLKHSFTKGIVSALNRTLRVNGKNGESYMQNLIQHDASLNPGNSGGPLLNLNGEVVGINTLKISGGEGIGFAIPVKSFSSLLKNVVGSNNAYNTPYLGAYGYDAEIAEFKNLSAVKSGFYLENIAENSPLKLAGLENGDVIMGINGKVITNALDLRNELYKHKQGDTIELTYFNGRNNNKVNITLSKK